MRSGRGRQADEGEAGLAQGMEELLQAATRMLAGVALRSLDALDDAVTLPQFRLLAVLADLGTVPTGQAARALGLDPSTVTRLADKMVTAGHIVRGGDPRHRGVVTLKLTGSGRELVDTAAAWRHRELARIMSRLAPADQGKVATALALLVDAAGEDYGLIAHGLVPRSHAIISGARGVLAVPVPVAVAGLRASPSLRPTAGESSAMVISASW